MEKNGKVGKETVASLQARTLKPRLSCFLFEWMLEFTATRKKFLTVFRSYPVKVHRRVAGIRDRDRDMYAVEGQLKLQRETDAR